MKKILCFIVFIFLCFMFGCGHIEDTNGPDDFSLVTISNQDILDYSSSAETMSSTVTIGNKTTVKIGTFSGVKSIYKNYSAKGDYKIIIDIKVEEGNLGVFVVSGDEILEEIPLNTKSEISVTVDKTLEIRIGGESAKLEIEYMIE